jgi:hypothetical protein
MQQSRMNMLLIAPPVDDAAVLYEDDVAVLVPTASDAAVVESPQQDASANS